MSEQFVALVAKMRDAQRKYFEMPSQPLLKECKKLEQRVDEWIQRHIAEKVQLDLWSRGEPKRDSITWVEKRTDQEAGAYNVTDETETEGDDVA